MNAIEITYARTHFYELIEKVAKGATILITRYGKPVARIVPAHPLVNSSAK
jgi:prevent-host-death family protein